VIVAFPGSLVFHERSMAEAPGFVLSRLYFMSALLDQPAPLARLCQSDGLSVSNVPLSKIASGAMKSAGGSEVGRTALRWVQTCNETCSETCNECAVEKRA
jgi:hypothetical protein